jgi:hypothetical protein
MRKLNLIIAAMIVMVLFTTSCEREALERPAVQQNSNSTALTTATPSQSAAKRTAASETCNPDAYTVTLESRSLVDGNWEWVWSIQNINPGNGNNGTAQDMSHWGMQLGDCVDPASIVSAGYSSNGWDWSAFNPAYQTDPSQGCMTTPVIKFEFGTQGSNRSYYRLVVNQEYSAGFMPAYYRSGTNTGCCTFYFMGISGCGGPVEFEFAE